MALTLDGTTGITSDGGTPVIENLDTTATGIAVTGVLTTTGNLLVGKTSAGIANNGFEARADGLTQITRAGGIVASLNRKTSDGTILEFNKDGVAVGVIGTENSHLTIGKGDTGIKFQGNEIIIPWNTETNTTKDNAIDLGSSLNRFKDLYLSGGVYVGGTGSANYLDDYEEGTWTPVVADAATGGNTGSATIVYAIYTKIGNQVTVNANLNNIVRTGLTTANPFHVRGLPFTSGTQQTTGSVRTELITYQGGRTMATSNVGPDDSWITFIASGSNLSDTSIDCGDLTSGTADMFFTITYFV